MTPVSKIVRIIVLRCKTHRAKSPNWPVDSWADGMKVYEAIGQSLYYASQTNKKPGIILLIRKNNSEKHIRKVKEVINFFELDINLIIKDLISKN